MEKHLEELRALRAAAVEAIATLKAERQAIADGAKAEERAALSADETAEFRAKSASIKAELDKVEDLDEQIRELESEIERSGKLEVETKTVRKATVEVNEALTYEKGNGQSYFRDLAMQTVGMADEPAKERLRRHMIDVESDKEIRKIAKVGEEYRDLDRNNGTGGYSVPPLWMMNRFIELARAGRTYANLCPTEPLPGGTSSINIPKIKSGTSTAVQAGDNTNLSDTTNGSHETDLTDDFVQANVKTIAGQQGVAIQLLDQAAVSVDEFVFRDLAADYANKLNVQVISGTGSNNQVVGVRATAGITQVTATGGSNALEKHQIIYQKIADAIQRVHTSRFLEPEVIVMHPRRWASFHAIFAGDDRPLIVPSGPGFNNLGVLTEVASQRVVGQMHGLPVVTDPTLPTTVNTDQDVIHVLRASDLALFESSVRMRALQETRAESLTVLLQVYGYLAFTAARFPQSVVEISGTALSAPTFA
ncbi:major capsid protein [Mycobacterium phage Lucky2013]|nr:major capsid protein [Mycobacterium phage Lucky2013]